MFPIVRANTLKTEAVDTGLLSYTGLDAAFDSSDIVLIAIDSETNEDATTANNGGTAVYRFKTVIPAPLIQFYLQSWS